MSLTLPNQVARIITQLMQMWETSRVISLRQNCHVCWSVLTKLQQQALFYRRMQTILVLYIPSSLWEMFHRSLCSCHFLTLSSGLVGLLFLGVDNSPCRWRSKYFFSFSFFPFLTRTQIQHQSHQLFWLICIGHTHTHTHTHTHKQTNTHMYHQPPRSPKYTHASTCTTKISIRKSCQRLVGQKAYGLVENVDIM